MSDEDSRDCTTERADGYYAAKQQGGIVGGNRPQFATGGMLRSGTLRSGPQRGDPFQGDRTEPGISGGSMAENGAAGRAIQQSAMSEVVARLRLVVDRLSASNKSLAEINRRVGGPNLTGSIRQDETEPSYPPDSLIGVLRSLTSQLYDQSDVLADEISSIERRI